MKKISRLAKHSLAIFLSCGFIVGNTNCFASGANDFDGYYILRIPTGYLPDSYNGSGIAQPPYFSIGKWVDSNPGVCPGITFPKTIGISSTIPDPTQPNSSNEIQIDPSAVAFPYNCYTTYTANIKQYPVSPPNNPTVAGKAECMVGVTLKVVSSSIEKVTLSATPIGQSVYGPIQVKCNAVAGMPFITFKG